jgi:hypothetical protein
LKQLAKLAHFKQKEFNITLTANLSCDLNVINPFYQNPCAEGDVSLNIINPKGYNVDKFAEESCVQNVGMDEWKDFSKITPAINKQAKELKALATKVLRTARKIAKSLGSDAEDDAIIELLEDIMWGD